MPHFVIDCNENCLLLHPPGYLIKAVHDAADSTGLFRPGDIKVRIRSFKLYTVGNVESDFIHIFGNIMEGRSIDQRRDLSERIIAVLKGMYPAVLVISININEFERATYCNRNLI